MTSKDIVKDMKELLDAGKDWNEAAKLIRDYIKKQNSFKIALIINEIQQMLISESKSASLRGILAMFLSEVAQEFGVRLSQEVKNENLN